jgi:hypothetical protein
MSRVASLKPILTAYRQLRSDSESARYSGYVPNAAEVQQDMRFFNQVANFIRKRLS